MSLPSPATLLNVARRAARQVAPPLAQAFRNPQAALGSDTKTNTHDLVTRFDISTEARLREILLAEVPGSSFMGEETGSHGSGTIRWVVDPIDGTSNFAHGFAMFSVSIAAVHEGQVEAGVVVDPANALEFSADDAGAYLNGEPLVPRPAPANESGYNVVTSFPAAEVLERARAESLEIFGDLVDEFATVRRTVSSALELCHVAAGWADVTFGVDTKPWDIAAGGFILTQAGGHYATGSGPGLDIQAPHFMAVAPGRNTSMAQRFFDRIATAARH